MTANGTVTLVPYGDDILEVTAHRLVERATTLPNLTNAVVLLPDLQFAARLRRQLLAAAARHGHAALLGPEVSTIDRWLCDHNPVER